MLVKPVTIKQLDSIYGLGLQKFKGEGRYTKTFLKETLKTHNYAYACFEGKKMLGVIIAKKYDRPKLWIFFFVVDQKHRRQGIGSKLLKTVEKHCNKSHPFLFVDFEEKDKAAKKFYAKQGFKQIAKVNHWFGLNQKGIIYFKKVI